MARELATERMIKEIWAKQCIRDAIYRYCRGEDRLDPEFSLSLWHADGTAKYGYNGELFDGPITGWAEHSHRALAEYMGSSHQVTNILIEVDDDRAVSEAYVTVRLWKMSSDDDIWQRVTVGRYLDRWSCRDGVWAVDHRRFIFDVSYSSKPTDLSGDKNKVWERNPDWFEGRHGPDDPSYAVLDSLTESASSRKYESAGPFS